MVLVNALIYIFLLFALTIRWRLYYQEIFGWLHWYYLLSCFFLFNYLTLYLLYLLTFLDYRLRKFDTIIFLGIYESLFLQSRIIIIVLFWFIFFWLISSILTNFSWQSEIQKLLFLSLSSCILNNINIADRCFLS